MFQKLLIYLAVLVSIGFSMNFSTAFFWEEEQPDLVPMDRLVFVGETLKMVCTLKESSSDMNSIQFRISNQREQTWFLPKEECFIGGLSVTANITVDDSFTELTTVDCWQNKTLSSLKSTYIFVERPIPKITDFSVVYLYREHISLSWSWKMQNLSKIEINIFWSASNTSDKNFMNDCQLRGFNGCRIPFEDYYAQDPIYVTINISMQRWNQRPSLDDFKPVYDTNATFLYKVNILKNTKSGPPENLAVINKNQTCFELSWKNPVYLMDCSTCENFYQIVVQREKAESSLDLQEKNFTGPLKNSSLVNCDLQAFTKYKVNLQVKGGEHNPWSDQATISFTTDEDRPLSGPLMNSTNYYIKDCFSGKRLLYIYWKEPPVDQVQGVLTKYEVVLNNNETYTVNKGSSYFKKDIQCHLDYNVSVFSVNSVNRSLSPSVIWIPGEHSDYSKELQFKVEEIYNGSISSNLKNVTVTWNDVSLENVNLVIYRCEEDYQQNFCLSEYTSMEVSLSSMSVSIKSIDVKENLFGFALKSENRVKQGIFWSGCIFKKEKEPEKPVGVQVITGHDGHSLVISWVPEPCNKISKAFIQFYNICISDIEGNVIKWILKPGFENNHTVESLQSNEEYIVKIQGVTPYNVTGPYSDPVQRMILPNTNDSSLIEIILPIVFSFVLIIIVLCGGYHFYKLCKKRRGVFKSLITTNRVCEDQKHPYCNGHNREINKDNCIQVNNNLTPPSINGSPPNETHNERIECVNNADVSGEENPQDRSDEGFGDLSGLNQQDYSKLAIETSETVSDDSLARNNMPGSKSCEVSREPHRSLEEQPTFEESQIKIGNDVNNSLQEGDESLQDVEISSEEFSHYSPMVAVDDISVEIVDSTAVIIDDTMAANSFDITMAANNVDITMAANSVDNTMAYNSIDDTINSSEDTSGSSQQDYVRVDFCNPSTNTDVENTSGSIQQDYIRVNNYSPSTNIDVENTSGPIQQDYVKLNIDSPITDVSPSRRVRQDLLRIY